MKIALGEIGWALVAVAVGVVLGVLVSLVFTSSVTGDVPVERPSAPSTEHGS